MSIRIETQPITDPPWLDFVSKKENASIFHHPAWADLLAECTQRTIQEITAHCEVNSNQTTKWKWQVIEAIPQVFTDHRLCENESDEALKAALHQQIGQLQVQLDWLKKSPACWD
jgi:transposase